MVLREQGGLLGGPAPRGGEFSPVSAARQSRALVSGQSGRTEAEIAAAALRNLLGAVSGVQLARAEGLQSVGLYPPWPGGSETRSWGVGSSRFWPRVVTMQKQQKRC